MTILLYSISKNMNNMNIFQLCVLFSFFKKFHINNTILISTLIHRFNYQVTINEAPKYISMFHNFLSYVKRKCVENYKVIEENKELLHMIQNGNEIFINKKNVGYENGQQILNNKLKEENNTMDNVHDDSPTNLVLFSKELKEIENNKYVVQCDELDKIREKTNDIKYNRYNMNILYIIQNSVKNIEMITRKHIKNMNVMSLCLLSCSISHINKNKYMLEQIAESLGKNSTKLCPSLVSSFLLSFNNDMSKLYYEDSNDYCHKDLLNNEKEKNVDKKKIINNYNKIKDHKYVNFSYIDYENIKRKNYYKNNLYNINNNIGSKYNIYINNIVYILEYYAFLLVNNINILKLLCNIFINSELNYILYSRIFYAFYILQFNDNIIYKLIHKFILHQPLYEVMYKEKHIIKIIEALKYYDDNKKEDKNSDIYFYVLPKKTFSFIFNFSKYFLTYIFLRKNENFLKSYLYPIKTLPFYNDESIYIHVSCNLFNKRL
ncbi:hypothetical protein PFDG_04337 [Plasmodium falciparum Dd2]|uniref:Uncharacterized protein n=1 Tax=Plasmodium falciparum (isolate Dd2) TaxID=57267 RepID=A0A0L7M4Y4_PLAF4|nr:hypothetical protein PFDG_04337 [Plasmodium falciparum Dd2]